MYIGELLVQDGTLSQADLEKSLARQAAEAPERLLGALLVEWELISPVDLLEALGRQFRIPVTAVISPDMLDPELVKNLPVEWARTHCMLPCRYEGAVAVLTADPRNIEARDDVSLVLGQDAMPVLAPEDEIRRGIETCYFQRDDRAEDFIEALDGDENQAVSVSGSDDLLSATESAPVTRLVNLILLNAVKARASDIHIEPFDQRLQVRYRVDGVLYEQASPPKHMEAALTSRLKVMGRLDIAEKRLPQDGMARVRVGEREIDVRISTVPVPAGERVVLRLLDRASALLPLNTLGMSREIEARFDELLKAAHGTIWVTGPTGGGKTTTLYAALQALDIVHRNILTIEDPIEYQLPGIGQIAVRPKIGLTFAQGLRHILRQDPDVILVGETRDLETAEIAIRASLTGHLVFSTLHTNDAPSAVTRLLDMGIPGYLLAAAARAVLAQRLVRVLCPSCREAYALSEKEARLLGPAATKLVGQSVYRPVGCEACREGYLGRTGLYELMTINDEIADAIRGGLDIHRLNDMAHRVGMTTLKEDGIDKIVRGITNVDEVLRVCGTG